MWGWDSEISLSRGRPQQTWDGVLKKDMAKSGLVREWAQDQERRLGAIRIPTLVKQGDRK